MDKFLKEIIKEAGDLAKKHFFNGVESKTKEHLGDLVTKADLEVSEFLIKKIQDKFPDHGIFSEEEKEIINPQSEFVWMIDPIDGTRNFAKAIPLWSIMVALWKNDEVIISAVYNPIANELFFAEKNKGATLNEMPIKTNDTSSLEHSFSYLIRGLNTPFKKEFNKMMDRVVNETTVWMHNFGGIGLGGCYLASGGVDFIAINCGYDYDYAAISLICKEAGALVTDCEGNSWKRGRRDLIIANPNLHFKVLELLNAEK